MDPEEEKVRLTLRIDTPMNRETIRKAVDEAFPDDMIDLDLDEDSDT